MRETATLLAVVLLAAAAAAAPAPRVGLNVGSASAATDMVADGVSNWTVAPLHEVSDVVNFVDFYVWLEDIQGQAEAQDVRVIWETDNEFTMSVFLEDQLVIVNETLTLHANNAAEVRLHAEIECAHNSSHGQGSLRLEMDTFASPQIEFGYNCSNAKKYARGFFVSDSPDANNGHVLVNNGEPPMVDYALHMGSEVDTLILYTYVENFSPNKTEIMYGVTVDSDRQIMAVSVEPATGVAKKDGVNTTRQEHTLHFACEPAFGNKTAVNGSVTVTFDMDADGVEDAFFDLVKECRFKAAEPTPARKGLSVGRGLNPFTDRGDAGKDVVRDGVVSGNWTLASPFKVDSIVEYLDLYLSLEEAEGLPNNQSVEVSWTPGLMDAFDLAMYLEDRKLEANALLNLTTGHGNQQRLHIEIVCEEQKNVSGKAQITLEAAGFKTMELIFSYDCTNSHVFATNFEVVATGVGKQAHTVVKGGQPRDDYSLHVPAGQDSVTLSAKLNQHNKGTLDYAISADYDEEYVRVSVLPVEGVAHGGGKTTDNVVKFECVEGQDVNTTVTLTYIFDGDEGDRSAFFDLVKFCNARAPDSDHGGWSAAGIVFFVLFLITLTLCVLGCGVNRFHFHKQGLDIIPGMPLFRRCAGRDQGVYTPQADLDDSNTGAYGSYQENL